MTLSRAILHPTVQLDCRVHQQQNSSSPSSKFVNCISLVDLPGFQQYTQSNFDAFCANYANERMHHFFLRKTLGDNNTEYRNEGLGNIFSILDYKEDTSRLDMYINMKYGLFAIMDRQANVLNGKGSKGKKNKGQREFDPTLSNTEASLQLLRIFTKNQREYNDSSSSPFKFGESKNELNNFSIQHYWGDVSYKIGDFVEKNVDSLSTDFIHLVPRRY